MLQVPNGLFTAQKKKRKNGTVIKTDQKQKASQEPNRRSRAPTTSALNGTAKCPE